MDYTHAFYEQPTTVFNCIAQTWIESGKGAPKMFLADNGGKFTNSAFPDIVKNRLLTRPSELLYNGIFLILVQLDFPNFKEIRFF